MLTNNIARSLCALAILGISSSVLSAQDEGYVDAGAGFQMGFPSGEFKDAIDRNSYGIGAHIGYNLGSLAPVMLGLDFGVMTYGNERRQEPFSSTIPDVTVEVERDYNIVQGHFLLRLGPNEGVIRPYLDGLIGFNYLYTNTTIQNKGNADEEIASSVNLDDFTFSLGGGGGLMVRVYSDLGDNAETPKKRRSDEGIHEAFISLDVRYLSGSEAEYLKPGSVTIEEVDNKPVVRYDITRSRTDMIVGRIGVTLLF